MNRLEDVFRKAQLGGPWAGKEDIVGRLAGILSGESSRGHPQDDSPWSYVRMSQEGTATG